MPVRFAGSCTSIPPDFQFRVASLELGPWPIEDLTQHETYCEAITSPLAFQGHWFSPEISSDLSNIVPYPVTITVPEPTVTLAIIAGIALLLLLKKFTPTKGEITQ